MAAVKAIVKVPTKCKNLACGGTNTWAKYQHVHLIGTRTWEQKAYGPDPDSSPHPSPCPNDGVVVPCVSVRCGTCGYVSVY